MFPYVFSALDRPLLVKTMEHSNVLSDGFSQGLLIPSLIFNSTAPRPTPDYVSKYSGSLSS